MFRKLTRFEHIEEDVEASEETGGVAVTVNSSSVKGEEAGRTNWRWQYCQSCQGRDRM
jgi:hypothetical protein